MFLYSENKEMNEVFVITISTDPSESEESVHQTIIADPTQPSTEPRPRFSCTFCPLLFRRKDALDRHIFHHTNEKKFRCNVPNCPKAYTNVAHLRRHMKNGHRDVQLEKTIKCLEPNCSTMFTNVSNMRHHFKVIHQQPKIYKCSECGEVFKRKQSLKRHRIVHTGVCPYVCSTCGHGSTSLKESKRHEVAHNAAKSRVCEDCGKTFVSWSALVAHRKVGSHSSEFRCNFCNRVFPAKRSLKYHLEIHKDRESREVFECPYNQCPRFYFDKQNLYAHIRSKHEGVKFVCGFNDCGRQLAHKVSLVKHLKNHIAERDGLRPSSQASSRRDSLRIEPRKDKGTHKIAAALTFAGLEERNRDVHRLLLNNQGHDIEVVTHDLTDEMCNSEIKEPMS